ncbi:urease accessory protein UreD [Ruminococcus sp. AM18-15]|jgi:urease accessory protein|nr:urease accessory protein UreD [Ruminococcus sp. AM18-44]RHO25886.1 urease accessory protein UreD [Ruminococcus sp. AM18-15]
MDNKFGKVSRISACAALKDGKTILEDLSFTAPYKIMTPFEKENGGIQIMPLCASAGIMAGDSQEFSYHVKEGADLEILSQSFEKIHKMDEGSASRTIEVQVDKNAALYYYPQPVIPFAQSAFDSKMTIHLEDETSKLFLLEIISCGRNAHEERFQYRRFSSKVLLYRGEKLIYRDNTRYEPDKMPMEGIGLYEGYTHMANLFLSKLCNRDNVDGGKETNIDGMDIKKQMNSSGTGRTSDRTAELQEKIWQILDEDSEIDGGVTRLTTGDLALRIFGHRAQKLQQIAEKIKEIYTSCQINHKSVMNE